MRRVSPSAASDRRDRSRPTGARRRGRRCAVTVLVSGLALWGASGARAQQPFAGTTIDGPNPAITTLGNVTLARDGSGAVTYLRVVGGAPHVFASIEQAGVWRSPVQIDAGLPGPASQPLVAAASGGRIAAVFISSGTIYGAVHDPGRAGFGTPQPLVGQASNPALAISDFGTAYTSFTAPYAGASAVFVARLDRESAGWQLMPQPLNLVPTDNAANTPATRSAIAVASDGEALVAWGEREADGRTHVIARRVSVAGVSVAPQDLNLPSLSGLPGGDADSPSVSLEDASDFGWVAFRQSFVQGAVQISRTIARHQYGSQFDPPEPPTSGFGDQGPTVIDPLTLPATDGADDPQVSIDGSGGGLASVETIGGHGVYGDPLNDPYFTGPERLDSGGDEIAPEPVAAIGGIGPVGGVAWLQSPAPTAPASVYVRAYNGSSFESPGLISAPALGGVQTGAGALSAAADHYGDTFVAFLQGAPTGSRIAVGGVAQPPQRFGVSIPAHSKTRRPVISWSAPFDALGIASYEVQVDGKTVGTTTATHFALTAALKTGRHTVGVVAVNRYGVSSTSTLTLLVRATGTSIAPAASHP